MRRLREDEVSNDLALALPTEVAMLILVLGCHKQSRDHYFGIGRRLEKLRTVSRRWSQLVSRGLPLDAQLIDQYGTWDRYSLTCCADTIRSLNLTTPLLSLLPGRDQLHTLRIEGNCGLGEHLARLTQLRELDLYQTGEAVLDQLVNLTTLSLCQCVAPVLAFDRLVNLRTLKISHLEGGILRGLAEATQLTALSIDSTVMGCYADHSPILRTLTQLRRLVLDGVPVNSGAVCALPLLENLRIFASRSDVRDTHFMRMTALRSLSLPAWGSSLSCLPTTLEKLNISYHPGMSPGALPLTTRLTTLNASNTLLDDQALAPLTSLTRLDIKGCSAVTDAALSRLTNLRRLCLYCMEQIGDEGLAPLTALTHLAIQSSRISVATILSLTRLTYLDVIGPLDCGDARLPRHLPLLRRTAYGPLLSAAHPFYEG